MSRDAGGTHESHAVLGRLGGLLLLLAAVALGVTAVVLGEADDSPGLQGLGVVVVAASVALGLRRLRRR